MPFHILTDSFHIWEDLPWWLSTQKIGNFCPSLCPLCGLFNNIWSLLMISSEPIGRSESKYAKIWSKIFAFTQQSNSFFFLIFLLTILEISYLKKWKSFWPNLKSGSWALVSAIKRHNMTRLYMLKIHGNFNQRRTNVNGQETLKHRG